jgi:hypothetical protein
VGAGAGAPSAHDQDIWKVPLSSDCLVSPCPAARTSTLEAAISSTHSKEVEQASAHVKVAIATARALVAHDGSGGLAAVRDGECPAAVRSGVPSAELGRIERDDEVRCDAVGVSWLSRAQAVNGTAD